MLDATPDDVSFRDGDDVRHSVSSVDHCARESALVRLSCCGGCSRQQKSTCQADATVVFGGSAKVFKHL